MIAVVRRGETHVGSHMAFIEQKAAEMHCE